MTGKICGVFLLGLLTACAGQQQRLDQLDAKIRPYSVGEVHFEVQTGPESTSAINMAARKIQQNIELCRRHAPSNKPRSDVILKIYGYRYQAVHGIFVPGRSHLSASATWAASGEDSHRFTIRGNDPFQNDLTTAPRNGFERFFSKPVADIRLANTFADSFIERLMPKCFKGVVKSGAAISTTTIPNDETVGDNTELISVQAKNGPTLNSNPIVHRGYSGKPTPPPA